jgi:hypothetical protein
MEGDVFLDGNGCVGSPMQDDQSSGYTAMVPHSHVSVRNPELGSNEVARSRGIYPRKYGFSLAFFDQFGKPK